MKQILTKTIFSMLMLSVLISFVSLDRAFAYSMHESATIIHIYPSGNRDTETVQMYPGEVYETQSYIRSGRGIEFDYSSASTFVANDTVSIYYRDAYASGSNSNDNTSGNTSGNTQGGEAYIHIDFKSVEGHNIMTTITIKGKHGEVLDANDYMRDIKTFKFHSFNPSSGKLTFDSKKRGTMQIVYEKDYKPATDSQTYPNTQGTTTPQNPVTPTNPSNHTTTNQGTTAPITVPTFKSSMIASERNIKLVGGYPDGTLKPKTPVKREEVAAIFHKLLAAEYQETFGLGGYVSDVKADSWAYPSISALVTGNIMPLKNDGKFYPKNNATRGEVAQILYAFIREDISEFDRPAYFVDVNQNTMGDAIGLVASKGLMVGYKDGTFQPNKEVTRAELLVVVNKLLGKSGMSVSNPVTFKDVKPTDWYYYDVQIAVQGK